MASPHRAAAIEIARPWRFQPGPVQPRDGGQERPHRRGGVQRPQSGEAPVADARAGKRALGIPEELAAIREVGASSVRDGCGRSEPLEPSPGSALGLGAAPAA